MCGKCSPVCFIAGNLPVQCGFSLAWTVGLQIENQAAGCPKTRQVPSPSTSENSKNSIIILNSHLFSPNMFYSMTFYDHVLVSWNALVADLTLYLYYWGASKISHRWPFMAHALLAHRVNILAGGKDNPGRQQKSEDIWDTARRCIKNTIKKCSCSWKKMRVSHDILACPLFRHIHVQEPSEKDENYPNRQREDSMGVKKQGTVLLCQAIANWGLVPLLDWPWVASGQSEKGCQTLKSMALKWFFELQVPSAKLI